MSAVLQVIPALVAGGAERTVIDIARALKTAGFEAPVASEGGPMESELADAGGTLIRLPVAAKNPVRIVRNALALADIIRTRNISLVHARSRAPAWSALMAARATGVPFVTTYHGIYRARSAAKRLYNSIMARGDAVIANSEWTARHVRETYPRLASRVIAIPRGVDLAVFDPAPVGPERIAGMRRAWGVNDEDRVILLPGRLTRWKGQSVLIAAMAHLREAGRLAPDIRAVILGEASQHAAFAAELETAIRRKGLEGIVLLAGHERDMAAAYRASDIVVSASTEPEAFGRVAAEAGAMGRPVIATDHGGARETILPGETGLLVPPGDAHALADALAGLLARAPDERAGMGAGARSHIAGRYTVERMCAATLAIYRELLGLA